MAHSKTIAAQPRCVLCGGASFQPRHQIGEQQVLLCRSCGNYQIDPFPSAGVLEEIYTDEQYYENNALFEPEIRRQSRVGLEKIGKYRAPGRLLDVGCARGYFLDEARQMGWETVGVELSPHTAAYARERYGLDVRVGDLDSAGIEDGSFDAAVVMQVIEHIASPHDFLRRVGRVLRRGGILFVATPNGGSFSARTRGSDFPLWVPREHVALYTPQTLPRLVEEAGFQVRQLDTWAADPHEVVIGLSRVPVVRRIRGKGIAGRLLHPFLRATDRLSIMDLVAQKA